MNKFAVKNILPGSYFTQPSYIDDQFILTSPEMPFTLELKRALTSCDFIEILSDGENQEEYVPQNSDGDGEKKTESESNLDEEEELKEAENFYQNFLRYAETLFTQIAVSGQLKFNVVAAKMKDVCDTIKEKRRYLLRVIRKDQNNHEADIPNYLAAHAVTSTIISVIIGMYLKLPPHRLIELGTAALLHEVGMLKLPPQCYMSKRALSPQERKAILTHPILSYNILKSSEFPLAIGLAALEHHERENGEGYPRKLTGDKISLYAKIIAVACSYEALTTARPHKDAKDGHAGMVDLLKNARKQYDDTIIRALVYSLSIYPIGLYVLLSNGQKGQVVDVNPANPQFPIVQILNEVTPEGKPKTVGTSPGGLNILWPLREEI